MNTSPSFVGRRVELEALREAYETRGSAFWPIYGRRRVGKSELILHFSKPYPTIYLLGKKASPEQHIREFLEVAAQALQEPLLATANAGDWKVALDLVIQR